MTDQNGTTAAHDADSHMTDNVPESKGKGKAVDTAPQHAGMGEDEEDSSDEETGAEEEEAVSQLSPSFECP